MKRFVGLIILTVVVVAVALSAAAAWSVWYRSTGFREQFQNAHKPQKAAYTPVPVGAVMVTGREPNVDSRYIASSLRNPMPATSESIATGKEFYEVYCAACHGKSGDGNGLMGSVPYLRRASAEDNQRLATYMSGYLGYEPVVNLSFVQEEPEGELYYTITNGGEAIMPAFRDAMTPEQRWHLINYIKRGLGGGIGD